MRTPTRILDSVRRGCALAALVAAAACGDDGGAVAGDILGTWALDAQGENAVYLRITPDSIVSFREVPEGSCYERRDFEVVDVDRTEFELAAEGDTVRVSIRRVGDRLEVTVFGDRETYVTTDADPGTLPVCAPFTPSEDCATLPAVGLDDRIEGALAVADPSTATGRRYDLYRLDSAGDSLSIRMESTELDPALALFDSAGVPIADNDDASNRTLQSELEVRPPDGCLILFASSASPAEFGAYTLTIDPRP